MEDFLPYAVATAIVLKSVDILKFIRAKNTNGWATQVVVWVVGIAAAFLLRESDFSASVKVGNFVLANLNWASTVLFGIAIGSTASTAVDFRKSFDNTDSAATPKLFEGDGA